MTGEIGVDWEQRVDWAAIREYRVSRLRERLGAAGIDGVLTQRFENLRYTTSCRPFTSISYFPRYASFVPVEGEVCLLSEAGDVDLNRDGMPWIKDLRVWPYDVGESVEVVSQVITDNGLTSSRIGYDDMVSPTVVLALAERFPGAEFADATKAIAEAKMIKSAGELEVIQAATIIAEVGMAAAREAVREGIRECDLAGVMTHAMFSAGADTLLAYPQVSTDPRRRMGTDRRVRHGDLVLVDINIGFNGYVGDFARTFTVSEPTQEQRDVFQVQLGCVEAAVGAVAPGVHVRDVQAAVSNVVEQAGLAEYWADYITGHGIGTGVGPLEQPIVGAGPGLVETLEEGMVIAFEPGIFKPGVGPMRNEEVVVVTADGAEVLTRSPYDERLSG
jgi:Xaa-Pro aminopeptidase